MRCLGGLDTVFFHPGSSRFRQKRLQFKAFRGRVDYHPLAEFKDETDPRASGRDFWITTTHKTSNIRMTFFFEPPPHGVQKSNGILIVAALPGSKESLLLPAQRPRSPKNEHSCAIFGQRATHWRNERSIGVVQRMAGADAFARAKPGQKVVIATVTYGEDSG